MNFMNKLKSAIKTATSSLYENGCGCGCKKLNMKGKFVALVVLMILIVSF
jgi:hypothetical protein